MTDITELAQSEINNALAQLKQISEYPTPSTQYARVLRKYILALVEALEKAQAINAAAEKLVRCKGRYHSEQNYRALAALLGVNTPELPPLEHENVHHADAAEMEIAALRQRIAELESRAVTVNLPQRLQPGADGWDDWYMHSDNEGEYLKFDDVLAMLTAAGIKVEAE